MEVICPYCNNPAKLVDSIKIYKKRSYGMIWLCRPCKAYVGTHKNSKRHAPLGRLANKELRKWKRHTHNLFDKLWNGGQMSRSEAYKWLRKQLNISKEECHIGKFDIETCKQVVELCLGDV